MFPGAQTPVAIWTASKVWVVVMMMFLACLNGIQCLLKCHHLTVGRCDSCCSSFLWTVDVGQYIFFITFVVVFRNIILKMKPPNVCQNGVSISFKPFCNTECITCMTKKLRNLDFWTVVNWTCLSFYNSPNKISSYHTTSDNNVDQATWSKILSDGFRTQIYNCLNVNAINKCYFCMNTML